MDPSVRASDAERSSTVEWLEPAHEEGRLSFPVGIWGLVLLTSSFDGSRTRKDEVEE